MANVQIRTVSVSGPAPIITAWYEPTPSKSRPQARQSVTVTPEGVTVDEKVAAYLVSINEDIDYVAKAKQTRPGLG
tara:strand:- start:2091 stop:2318 length:228 start_codon:yes stop_codon:yes gene_type:complete